MLEDKIAQYAPSEATVAVIARTPLLLLSSVVAGGKNTVTNELLQHGGYQQIVTHTTRPPRSNEGVMETDGVEYHFINLEEAERMVDEQSFVEVKYVHGNVYGSTVNEFERISADGTVAVGDVDVQGIEEYLAIKPDTHAIFLLPPSVDTWLARLTKRYGDLSAHTEEIEKRFQTAYGEITQVMNDKRFIIVVNDDLATTVERIKRIVSGEKHETSDYADAVMEHLLDFLKTRLNRES